MNTAIIVAAGSGQRFAGSKPKQFLTILGKPLIIHTLERFESCPAIDEIVLVLSEEGLREFEMIKLKFTISKLRPIVIGGATRAESVKNALDSIEAKHDDIIAVHDGARPLVSVDEITRTVNKAAATGAACLVAEINDTVKEVNGENIRRTVDRRRLRRALTPQAFRYAILKRAFDRADLTEEVTDECYLVESLVNNCSIAMVEGSSRNIKVTRPEDLVFVESYLKENV